MYVTTPVILQANNRMLNRFPIASIYRRILCINQVQLLGLEIFAFINLGQRETVIFFTSGSYFEKL